MRKIVVSQVSGGFVLDLVTIDVQMGKFGRAESEEFVGAESLGTRPTRKEAFEFARAESKRLGVELKSLE